MDVDDLFEPLDVHVSYYSLGRHALFAALNALDIGEGDYVLVPGFICRDLLASINALNAKPLFYSVKEDLAPVSLPSKENNIKAILAVNYFGFPQDLEPFYQYCSKYSVYLIEDNAHGFLSRDHNNVLLGTRADFGIFSFRKTFYFPDGAALAINNKISPLIEQEIKKCNDSRVTSGFYIKQSFSQIQKYTHIPVKTFSEKVIRLLRKIKTGRYLPLPLPDAETVIPGTPEIKCRTLQMLKNKNLINESKRRCELYSKFELSLRTINVDPIFKELPENTVPYGFPFRATDENAAAVCRLADKEGLNCSKWPDLPDELLNKVPEYYKNVWWVNFLC